MTTPKEPKKQMRIVKHSGEQLDNYSRKISDIALLLDDHGLCEEATLVSGLADKFDEVSSRLLEKKWMLELTYQSFTINREPE